PPAMLRRLAWPCGVISAEPLAKVTSTSWAETFGLGANRVAISRRASGVLGLRANSGAISGGSRASLAACPGRLGGALGALALTSVNRRVLGLASQVSWLWPFGQGSGPDKIAFTKSSAE